MSVFAKFKQQSEFILQQNSHPLCKYCCHAYDWFYAIVTLWCPSLMMMMTMILC